MPEVSLVAILDADKEGFLAQKDSDPDNGRAARNINGRAILYADQVTKSMQKAIDEIIEEEISRRLITLSTILALRPYPRT